MIYAPIPGFPNYHAGSDGTIWYSKDGAWRQRKLTPNRKCGGRFMTCLSGPSGNQVVWVHRVVLEAFVGPCPAGYECCHNNGDRLDNRAENMRWDTRAANYEDLIRHGGNRATQGTHNVNAKLTDDDVREIVRMVLGGSTQQKAAIRFGVRDNAVSRIMSGHCWNHVTGFSHKNRKSS